MSEHDDLSERLADLVGIARGYTDYFGNPVASPIEARRAILADFGLPTETEALARESLARVEELRHGLVPRLIPVEAGRTATIPVRGSGDTAVWRLTDEGGALQEGRASLSAGAQGLVLPRLAPGYYRLTVDASGRSAEATVIAAPRRCYEMRELTEGARYWGLAAQLYSFRSEHNLGIGTYLDTADAAAAAGALGASFVGLSPVHALFAADRTKISPYSPSSRLFLETLHIDPTAAPGFAGSRAAALLAETAERIASLRDTALVDHAGVWNALRPVLDALWADF